MTHPDGPPGRLGYCKSLLRLIRAAFAIHSHYVRVTRGEIASTDRKVDELTVEAPPESPVERCRLAVGQTPQTGEVAVPTHSHLAQGVVSALRDLYERTLLERCVGPDDYPFSRFVSDQLNAHRVPPSDLAAELGIAPERVDELMVAADGIIRDELDSRTWLCWTFAPSRVTGTGYWLHGHEIYPIDETHIAALVADPALFDLSDAVVAEAYRREGETPGSEGNARESLIKRVAADGWVRVRHYRTARDYWSIQADTIVNAIPTILRFVRWAHRQQITAADDELVIVGYRDGLRIEYPFHDGGAARLLEP